MRWVLWATTAALLWPGAAAAGWRGAEWGMSPEQVAAATPVGVAPIGKPPKPDKEGKFTGNAGRFEAGGFKFTTAFTFDDKGLASVGLTPTRAKACQAFAKATLAERGQPLRVSDQTLLMLLIWHEADAGNRVRLLLPGAGAGCTLYYERLSDYEEADKRLKAEGR